MGKKKCRANNKMQSQGQDIRFDSQDAILKLEARVSDLESQIMLLRELVLELQTVEQHRQEQQAKQRVYLAFRPTEGEEREAAIRRAFEAGLVSIPKVETQQRRASSDSGSGFEEEK